MKLISVNVAEPRPSNPDDPSSKPTGINKLPAPGPTRIGELGLEGDAICSTQHHGGPDQAVYVYGLPDYEWWSRELGRALAPGTFGENLTVSDFSSADARVGDRLRIGEVVLEATSARIPCGTFAIRMQDESFPKRFRLAERPGVYFRVIAEGTVAAGDAVRYERFAGATVSILDMQRDFYQPELSEAAIRRFLHAPIASRARLHKESQLRKLIGA